MKKKKNSKPHFAKIVDYSPEEIWRTDFAFGQKGAINHGHLATSGAAIWYLRDEQGKEIIVNGNILSNNIVKGEKENENRG